MIAVDTSALYAIISNEAEGRAFFDRIEREDATAVGAPTLFELRLVVQRRAGPDAPRAVDKLLIRLPLTIVPWTAEHVLIAQDALLRFGGQPARLNFGDCMAYAVAKSLDAPLLYKGADFAQTDIRSAL